MAEYVCLADEDGRMCDCVTASIVAVSRLVERLCMTCFRKTKRGVVDRWDGMMCSYLRYVLLIITRASQRLYV